MGWCVCVCVCVVFILEGRSNGLWKFSCFWSWKQHRKGNVSIEMPKGVAHLNLWTRGSLWLCWISRGILTIKGSSHGEGSKSRAQILKMTQNALKCLAKFQKNGLEYFCLKPCYIPEIQAEIIVFFRTPNWSMTQLSKYTYRSSLCLRTNTMPMYSTPTCLLTYEVHFRTLEITYTDRLLLYCIHTCVSPDFDITLCYFYYTLELLNSWAPPHTLVYKL